MEQETEAQSTGQWESWGDCSKSRGWRAHSPCLWQFAQYCQCTSTFPIAREIACSHPAIQPAAEMVVQSNALELPSFEDLIVTLSPWTAALPAHHPHHIQSLGSSKHLFSVTTLNSIDIVILGDLAACAWGFIYPLLKDEHLRDVPFTISDEQCLRHSYPPP